MTTLLKNIDQDALRVAEEYVAQVFEAVKLRNPNESEFHQAVKEIFDSLIPVFAKHPQYMENGDLE